MTTIPLLISRERGGERGGGGGRGRERERERERVMNIKIYRLTTN